MVHVLNSAGLLRPEEAAEVRATAEQTAAAVGPELRLGPVDVIVGDFPGWAISELGVGGFAPGPHTSLIAIEPANPHFSGWRESLPMTLAHELHHVARWQGPGYGRTLLDSLVSEGTATFYEAQRFGVVPIYARSEQDPAELWHLAAPLLSVEDRHASWFFGAGELPRWSGYFLGYELARRFCAATGTSAAEAAHLPSEAFLRSAW